ncbi:unnamed protein product [Amoebophrya sp. A120]|nr:unnamed protein product [Amoebophrya sp. A120]|eukprot:GSA120T00009942001.1
MPISRQVKSVAGAVVRAATVLTLQIEERRGVAFALRAEAFKNDTSPVLVLRDTDVDKVQGDDREQSEVAKQDGFSSAASWSWWWPFSSAQTRSSPVEMPSASTAKPDASDFLQKTVRVGEDRLGREVSQDDTHADRQLPVYRLRGTRAKILEARAEHQGAQSAAANAGIHGTHGEQRLGLAPPILLGPEEQPGGARNKVGSWQEGGADEAEAAQEQNAEGPGSSAPTAGLELSESVSSVAPGDEPQAVFYLRTPPPGPHDLHWWVAVPPPPLSQFLRPGSAPSPRWFPGRGQEFDLTFNFEPGLATRSLVMGYERKYDSMLYEQLRNVVLFRYFSWLRSPNKKPGMEILVHYCSIRVQEGSWVSRIVKTVKHYFVSVHDTLQDVYYTLEYEADYGAMIYGPIHGQPGTNFPCHEEPVLDTSGNVPNSMWLPGPHNGSGGLVGLVETFAALVDARQYYAAHYLPGVHDCQTFVADFVNLVRTQDDWALTVSELQEWIPPLPGFEFRDAISRVRARHFQSTDLPVVWRQMQAQEQKYSQTSPNVYYWLHGMSALANGGFLSPDTPRTHAPTLAARAACPRSEHENKRRRSESPVGRPPLLFWPVGPLDSKPAATSERSPRAGRSLGPQWHPGGPKNKAGARRTQFRRGACPMVVLRHNRKGFLGGGQVPI